MDHRWFGIAALAPRMATVGMKIQASRSPLSERPEVRFRAVHAARFHRASLSLETDLVRSTEGARHSPSGLDGNREATTGRGNIARPILTTRRREASRRRFLPSATARSQTTRTVRSRRRSPKPVHAGTRAAACRRGLSRGREVGPSPSRAESKPHLRQLQTADRSTRASMKNAANCVNQCELQDTLIIDTSNAHGGPAVTPWATFG